MFHEGFQGDTSLEEERQDREKKFWKGPHMRVARSVTIPPGAPNNIVHLSINPRDLLSLHPDILTRTYISTRSRLAQAGVDIDNFGGQLAHFLEVLGEETPTAPFIASVVLDNYAERPLSLVQGARVGRPFFEGSQATITGDELIYR